MKIGDRVQVRPCSDGGGRGPVMATVVYIHPRHRYFVAEYSIGCYTLLESFHFEHRRG